MISNFYAIIFESHQFLFQFWKGMSLIEEYLWQSSKRWVSSSILLPLQRGHILSSRGILSYLPVSTRRLWQPILSFTRVLLMGFFRHNPCALRRRLEASWTRPFTSNGLFAADDHMEQKLPYWRADCTLGHIKQRKFCCSVLDVPVPNLLSSMAVFEPCDHQLQRVH